RETEVNEFTVTAAQPPPGFAVVTTTTPVMNRAKASRSRRVSIAAAASAAGRATVGLSIPGLISGGLAVRLHVLIDRGSDRIPIARSEGVTSGHHRRAGVEHFVLHVERGELGTERIPGELHQFHPA